MELADEFGGRQDLPAHRDVERFSADKSPYKTNCAVRPVSATFLFALDGLSVGSGLYMPDAGQLQRFPLPSLRRRRAIIWG